MKYSYLLVFSFIILALSGCNTMKGVGQDVESAGRGISSSSEKVQEDLQN